MFLVQMIAGVNDVRVLQGGRVVGEASPNAGLAQSVCTLGVDRKQRSIRLDLPRKILPSQVRPRPAVRGSSVDLVSRPNVCITAD